MQFHFSLRALILILIFSVLDLRDGWEERLQHLVSSGTLNLNLIKLNKVTCIYISTGWLKIKYPTRQYGITLLYSVFTAP